MNSGSTDTSPNRNRLLFWLIFLGVTGVIGGTSYAVIGYVNQQAQPETNQPPSAASLYYVDYNTNVDDYVSEEAYLAMGQYLYENEETINVQVLTDASPQELVGYMLNYYSAGLQVNCDYCHSLQNFAADVWDDPVAMANKNTARLHTLVSQDLNRNWLDTLTEVTQEKQPSGAQIVCATCHNGVAVPNPYEGAEFGVLGPEFSMAQVYAEDLSVGYDENILNVNGRYDISLETVQYQQKVMYHMNSSMNVGCTHCHNSRYFPSNEVPAKLYSQHMLGMNQALYTTWSDAMNGSEPSCLLCHQGEVIPPGSARNAEVVPVNMRYEPE